MEIHAHSLSVSDVAKALNSDDTLGLAEAAISERRKAAGFNELPEARRRSWLAVFIQQFKSPLVYLLLASSVVAIVMKHAQDALVIFVVVFLNALIGAVQEGRAEKALSALRNWVRQSARVIRDGKLRAIEARELVPGDLISLEPGDAVSADARLVETRALQLSEAALTGESLPVHKDTRPLPEATSLPDRTNMVYAGTHVTAGRGRALVVATGPKTQIGRIAHLAETAEQPKTPLELRIETFGRYLLYASAALFVVIVILGKWRGFSWGDIVMLGISQVVSMVPEGLPVAVTIALAVGVQRMAQRKAVVRRLSAIETLGSTTVICTDKTGTLTRNEMTVTELALADGRVFRATGVGYAPDGFLTTLEGTAVEANHDAPLNEFLKALVLCNDAHLRAPKHAQSPWTPLGDPTEVALLTLAHKAGVVPDDIRAHCPRRAEIPFDSASKVMATQHEVAGASVVFLKGAPEVMAGLAQSSSPLLQKAAQDMASRALRVLAVGAYEGTLELPAGVSGAKGKVRLLGLVGQMDPPRAEVEAAIAECQTAGIRPVMVTGDHKATGLAIAQALNIADDESIALDGVELEKLTSASLSAQLNHVAVFARVHPEQKLRIVSAYQSQKHVVAMTGDGVNDSPALVKANVGVAMGLSGTDVAKEAAKVVLTDDNFATLVAAIEEGRVVYRNIKKLILYLFSTNIAEVLVLLLALVFGLPPPLVAVQILWINLVTDGALTIPIIMEPKEGDEMKRPPISNDEPLLTRALIQRMVLMAAVITASTLGWYVYRISAAIPLAQAQTEAFTILAFGQLFNALNCRSERQSAFTWKVFKNRWMLGGLILGLLLHLAVIFVPPLASVFRTTVFDVTVAAELVAVSSLVLWAEEGRKWMVRLRG